MRRRTDWAALRAQPLAMLLIGFLLFLLIPLGITPVAAIGFLTLIAMTLSLAAGLTIVSAVLAWRPTLSVRRALAVKDG
ncbi:MAG TPA: hypothetical protein VE690_05035, partial [Rhodopila sp.]|nr:hypothetical protein [Rhodopila sp.]